MSGQRVTVYQPTFSAPVLQAPRVQRQDVSSGLESIAGGLDQAVRQRDATEVVQGRTQAAAALADLKLETLRQPWQARQQFFEGQAQGILAGIEENMSSDNAKGMLSADWAGMYQNHLIDVKQSAYAGEKDQNTANLDLSLEQFARDAAAAPSEEQANVARQNAIGQIVDMEGGGWISKEEAGKRVSDFSRSLDRNRARILIDKDPTTALQALNDQKQFQNLRAEDRIALQERADSKIQHIQAQADHAMIVNERMRKLAGDQLAKEGEDLLARGQMTEEWFNQNRNTLDPSDYRILRHAAQEGGGVDSAPFLADTYDRLYNRGDDIGTTVIEGMRTGKISAATAKSLLNENQSSQGVQSPRQQGIKYITSSLKVSDLNPDPAAAQRLAEAVVEFNRQVAADPKADPMTVARDLTKRYALINFQDMTLTAPLPKYAVGGRQDLDVQASITATWKQYLAKHNGNQAGALADPEYQREALLLKRWKEAIEKQRAQAVPTGGVK